MEQAIVLAGKKDQNLLRISLEKFLLYSKKEVFFRVISDGSLDKKLFDDLKLGKNAELITNETIETWSQKTIAETPIFRNVCRNNFLCKKILYVACASETNRINYMDSDIVARQPFTGLFDRDNGNFFMDNRFSMISIHWKNYRFLTRWSLMSSINCGLFSIDKSFIDFAILERVLIEQDIYSGSQFHLEQSLWSVLAGRRLLDTYLFSPTQIAFPTASPEKNNKAVLLHFTQPIRHLLEKDVFQYSRCECAPTNIREIRGKRLRVEKFLAERLKHKASRFLIKQRSEY